VIDEVRLHEMRSRVLQAVATEARHDPAKARMQLETALERARGPLVEEAADGSGEIVITFVRIGPTTPPIVRSPLFPVLDWQSEMRLLPGTADVWWTEASTTLPALRTHYRFLSGPAGRPDFGTDDGGAELVSALEAAYELGLPDPFNPRRCYPSSAFGKDDEPPYEKWDSLLALPEAESRPWEESEPARRGTFTTIGVHSAVLGNRRRVTIWRPESASAQPRTLPLVVLLDGEDVLHGVNAAELFPRLVSGGFTPPFVAALIHNPTATSRMTEYPCNSAFVDFVADELIQELRELQPAPLRPTRTIIGGFSYGGLAALWLAFRRPDVFGGVVASSPSMWWGPGVRLGLDPNGSSVNGEWLTAQYAGAEARDLRIWIDLGLLEIQELPFVGGINMLSSCARFRDVLTAKGYDVIGYLEQPSGHEYLGWRNGLAHGLIALLSRAGPRETRSV